ncbi:MAG: hypothetical protein QM773_02125 [Hyphomonadaceae bacterium]
MRKLVLVLLALAISAPAFAQADDDTKIRAVIAEWYKRVAQPETKTPLTLMAPNGIDAGPGFAEIPYIAREERSAAAYSGPRINNELAGKAMRFAYDIDRLTVNANLARADVWERGYFYAWAAQQTYELAADAMFVLEKQPDGEWLILAHQATSQGIPPNRITSPMPDLRAEYYANCPACDPVADAQKAKEW